MRALVPLIALVGCYAPTAAPGAPCSPGAPVCPVGQTCTAVGTGYACVAGAGSAADGGNDVDALAADAPMFTIDAPPRDAPVAPDAPPVPWQLVQTAASTSATTSLTATVAGDLVIVAIEDMGTAMVTSVTDNAPGGGSTYTAIANSHAKSSAAGAGVELWYAYAVAGATAITISPAQYSTVIWEVAGIRASGALDAVTTLNDQAASTTPVGAAITTTKPGDFVVAVSIMNNAVSGIHTGNAFTNDKKVDGNGWAHLTSATAPAGTYQAEWDQPTSGAFCSTSAAFFAAP